MKRILVLTLLLWGCGKEEIVNPPQIVEVKVYQPVLVSLSEIAGWIISPTQADVWAYGTAVSTADARLLKARPFAHWFDNFDSLYANKWFRESLGWFGKLDVNAYEYSRMLSTQDYLDPYQRVHWLVRDTIPYFGGFLTYDFGVRIGGKLYRFSGALKKKELRWR